MVITDVNQVVYQGDGVTTAFPFTFRIIDATDIKLLLIDADGAETDITSDFFVDTVNNTVHYPGYAPGAEPPEADWPAPVQTGQRLVVYRELPITQEKDLGDKWPFFVIELALDKLTMILQQIKDWYGRTLKVSLGKNIKSDIDLTVPMEPDTVITVNKDGTGFEAREALMEVDGVWDGEGRRIVGVADPAAAGDVATKNYADANFMKLGTGGAYWEGRGKQLKNVENPTEPFDAANKRYVDKQIEEAPDGIAQRIYDEIDKKMAEHGDGTHQYDHNLDIMPAAFPVSSSLFEIDENGDIMPKEGVAL